MLVIEKLPGIVPAGTVEGPDVPEDALVLASVRT
jgi:hypothetical protein